MKLKSIIRQILNRIICYKFKIPYDCQIHYSAKLKSSIFEGCNKISANTVAENMELGYASYIGMGCRMSGCKIGRYSSIGQNVQVVTGRHPSRDWVSMHPAFYSPAWKITYTDNQYFEEYLYADKEKHKFVNVGNDVWIGNNVSLLQGINIGNGAIIGTGAVVTKDVPAYAIVGGIPAKLIRYRFNERDRIWLENLKWWDMGKKRIMKMAPYFNNIDRLKENCK